MDKYISLCLKLQALRRDFERARTPLTPAYGVGADLYAHQLANVERVLTDVRVRHLLADEVGLGKTVQALMILNALRVERRARLRAESASASRGLRALIIVPDTLVSQWQDELMTRAHVVPVDEESEVGAEQVRLTWEGAKRFKLDVIDPEDFDLLIVDELHRLSASVQDRVVERAHRFQSLLVLTATPAFQLPARHAQLFELLEPERAALIGQRVEPASSREERAQALVTGLLTRDRLASLEEATEEVALAQCAYRRVIRTRRADYPGVLPRRRHIPLVVEPLAAERERQALMWAFFPRLGELTREFDPVKLARRVVLSPPSLRQRVDFFIRKGHDRGGLIARVRPLVADNRGDSRADALVEQLREIWCANPRERVLVAAQDNLTVDYLSEFVQARLPEVGPLRDRHPLVVSLVRQGMETKPMEDLGDRDNQTNENVEEFQRGEAQVLFAADVAQLGLNLQTARILILYSVPWHPEEVEQWIGRLDRIGNTAAFTEEGEARTIDVYTIVQRDLVDEKVVRVLKRFGVFERGVNLDGAHLTEVTDQIEAAALSERGRWTELEARVQAFAEEEAAQELDSPLRAALPWGPAQARAARDRFRALPQLSPPLFEAESRVYEERGDQALPSPCSAAQLGGPRGLDLGFAGLMTLIKKSKAEYHFRSYQDERCGRFETLWYRYDDQPSYGRRRAVASQVIFNTGTDPDEDHHPRNAHAYILRRGQLGTPPHRAVSLKFEESDQRRLRFLSFGDLIHDQLIEGWLPEAEQAAVDVFFDPSHEVSKFLPEGGGAQYVVRVRQWDAARCLEGEQGRLWEDLMAVDPDPKVFDRNVAQRPALAKVVASAVEADIRWLRAKLPGRWSLDVSRRVGLREWRAVQAPEGQALLNPLLQPEGLPRHNQNPHIDKADLAAMDSELKRLRALPEPDPGASWRLDVFRRALNTRLHVIKAEEKDSLGLAQALLAAKLQALEATTVVGDRGRITRAARELSEAHDEVERMECLWRARIAWLEALPERLQGLRAEERFAAFMQVRRV